MEERRALLASVDACCAALENTAPSEDSVTRARDSWLAERLGRVNEDVYGTFTGRLHGIMTMGAKYLTNSRLLRIQLRDAVRLAARRRARGARPW